MDQTLTPDCWRSEAFAEDLCDTNAPLAVVAPTFWRTRLLLGALPLLLATAGAVGGLGRGGLNAVGRRDAAGIGVIQARRRTCSRSTQWPEPTFSPAFSR